MRGRKGSSAPEEEEGDERDGCEKGANCECREDGKEPSSERG